MGTVHRHLMLVISPVPVLRDPGKGFPLPVSSSVKWELDSGAPKSGPLPTVDGLTLGITHLSPLAAISLFSVSTLFGF